MPLEAAEMGSTILRLIRTDRPSEHLLVQVSQSGNKELDLKLIGTEHEHLYHAELKEASVKSLQANSFNGDLNEWKAVLKYALLRDKPDGQPTEHLQGLETVAAIAGKSLTVTIRKNIGGITQRLGDIKLQQDDEKEEVAAFEWVDAAVATADDLRDSTRDTANFYGRTAATGPDFEQATRRLSQSEERP